MFTEFAPAAPHDPATAEPTFDGAFRDIAKWRPPSYDEADVSDKPAYMQALPRLLERVDGMDRRTAPTAVRDPAERRRADRTLLDALEETGRLEDTLIMFTSDNGLLWGEHRWMKKEVPYDEALRVPMVVRYDAWISSRAPTITWSSTSTSPRRSPRSHPCRIPQPTA